MHCSVEVSLGGSSDSHHNVVQSPAHPRGRQDGRAGEFSPSSPSQARCRELLRKGSLKATTLEKLRERIQQQRLDRKPVVAPEGSHLTLVTHRGCITRKICRVTFAPSPSTLSGLSAVGVTSITKNTNQSRGTKPTSVEKTDMKKDCFQTVAGKKILSVKPCRPVISGRNKGLEVSNNNLKKSPWKPVSSQTPVKFLSPPRNRNLTSSDCTPVNTSPNLPKKSSSKYHTPSKITANKNPYPTVSSESRHLGVDLGGKENSGSEWPRSQHRCSAQELREFMGQKERDRKRRDRQKKEEVQREEERKRTRIQEVLRKQRAALNRAKGRRHPQNLTQVEQSNAITDPGQRKEASCHGRGRGAAGLACQGTGGTPVEQVSSVLDQGGNLEGGACAVESRVQRVEALRKVAAVLGTRVEEEATRLEVTWGLVFNPTSRLTGPIGSENLARPTSVSEGLLQGCEPIDTLSEMGDHESKTTNSTAGKIHAMLSGVGWQGSTVTALRTDELLGTSHDPRTSTEGPLTALEAVEQWLPLQDGRDTPQSEHSDRSGNTDSTSKWSELSEFFGHRELLSRLSVAMSQQSLREEELRARHHIALCKLREEALLEKAQAELAWLDHRRRCLKTGEESALAGITRKEEVVVNRMRQEQAEIRHWRNLYQSGRQQRKLLLQHQKEVLEIRKSAAQLVKDLQKVQRHTKPRGTQPHPMEGQNQYIDPSSGEGPTHMSPIREPSTPKNHGLHSPRKDWKQDTKKHRRDTPERHSGDLGHGWICPTMQQGQASFPLGQNFPKNTSDLVTYRTEESRISKWTDDLLLEDTVDFQDSQTDSQDRDTLPFTLARTEANVKARAEDSEQSVLDRKTLEAMEQHAGGMFFSKTDASLRRLLSAEDVWNWGRRRVSPAEMAPAEQDEVGEPGYSGPSPGCPQKGQPPPRDSIQTDGQSMAEEEEGESETMATMVVRSQCNHPTAFVSEGDPQNHDPLSVGESGPQERVSEEETESWSDESSSTSVPLRVRSLPNSAEVSWRSQKSVCSCASLPEFQRASAVCMNVSELSSSSSDLDEDLPLDMEDSGWRGVGHSSLGDLEKPTGATPEPQTTPIGEPQQHEGNTVAFNVQNDQRSQSMLPSNNNSEIMPSCYDTETGDCSHMTLQASTGSGQVDSQHSPGLRSPALDAGSGDAESSSVDSGTEEGSEALSFSSEGLSSSEEELDQPDPGADAPRGEKEPVQLSDPSEPGASNAMHHEAKVFSFPASTDVMQSNPEEQAVGRKFGVNKPDSFVSWKPPAPEEALSEILSPVDEVLSYGSAELPPTIADDLMLPPPPPACEVITWTSDEGFPPPSQGLCWPQNEGNPLEDPSIKSDDLTSLSEDLLLPVNTGLPTGLRDRWSNDGDLKVGIEMPSPEVKGYSADQRSWGFQGKEEQKSNPFVTLSKAEDEEEKSSSDQLSCFCTGDRVLVCGSRPGQLRFKGKTHFANGYWAGVALDCPTGNHDGAFQGVRYFQCDKNCGVLVRAEDISHLLGEQDSDQETRADDPFSDEEPPSCGTKPPLGRQEESPGGGKSSGAKQEWSRSQCQAEARKCGAGDRSTATHMCRDHIFPREVNNNPQQVSTYVLQKEKHSSTAPHSDSCINAAQCQGGTHCKVSSLKEGALDTEQEEEFGLITPGYRSAAVCFSEHLKGHRDSNDLCVGGTPSGYFRSPPQGAHQNEQNCSQTPRVCLGSPLQERKIGSHPAPHSKPQVERVGCSDRGAYDVDFLVERLMDNLLMQVVKEAEEVRKRFQRKRSSVTKDNHSQNPQAVRSERAQARPSPCQRSTPLCFSDQWHCSLASATQPKVQVQPHDPGVVHKLVEASVEALSSQAEGCIADSTEAPAYLANEESRRAYQQVIFDLTSDILHETLRDCWGNSRLPWELKERSSVFPVHSSETPLSDIKAVIQAEVQRELNLGRTDAQTREMMQNLCKYGMAFRDRVDNVLVRELHKEELQWVDYSLDEHSVKMQLTEEIFNILLQDTISVLNHIYAAPSDVSPPAMQPTQLSLKP